MGEIKKNHRLSKHINNIESVNYILHIMNLTDLRRERFRLIVSLMISLLYIYYTHYKECKPCKHPPTCQQLGTYSRHSSIHLHLNSVVLHFYTFLLVLAAVLDVNELTAPNQDDIAQLDASSVKNRKMIALR